MTQQQLENSPIEDRWRWLRMHWHAYSYSAGVQGVPDRAVRLVTEPHAVLTDPADVARWIEDEYARHAPDTQPDSGSPPFVEAENREGAEYRLHTNAVVASRGGSIYVEVKNLLPGKMERGTRPCRDLFVEAVTACGCVD